MKKVYQSLLAATCKFLDLSAPRVAAPVCVDRQLDVLQGQHTTDPDTDNVAAVEVDEPKEPWLIKIPIGKIIKDLPQDMPWIAEEQGYLPRTVAELAFGCLDQLKEIPLVACLPLDFTLNNPNCTFPYTDLEVRLDGTVKYQDGVEYEVYTLLMVIDPNCPDYPACISNLFYFDIGTTVKFSESTYVSGGVVTPMHFCLSVDEDYHGYRIKTYPNPMEDDVYHVVLSVLDHAPTWYDKESFVRYLNEDNSFTKRLREGTLFGEASQPSLKNYPNPCDREARIFEIDLSNVGFVVKDIWTIDDTPIGYAGNAHPSVTMVMGKIKPTGPMADVVRAHLENPAVRTHFGMRGFVIPDKINGRRVNKIHSIVTFDLVH